MGFLDNDYGGRLVVEYGNGQQTTKYLPELGDNAYETVDINLPNVRRITFIVERSGAIAYIRFRPGQPPIQPPVRQTSTIRVPFNTIFVTDVDTCFDPVRTRIVVSLCYYVFQFNHFPLVPTT